MVSHSSSPAAFTRKSYQNAWWKECSWAVVVGLLTSLFLLYLMFHATVTMADDTWSFFAIQESWGTLFTVIVQDTHPPLHYLLGKLSVEVFGSSLWAARIPTMAAFFGMLLWGSVGLYRLFGKKTANIFTFLYCTCPPLIWMGLVVRMYELAYFFVCGVTLTALSIALFPGVVQQQRSMSGTRELETAVSENTGGVYSKVLHR